jgi:hypothetical protein
MPILRTLTPADTQNVYTEHLQKCKFCGDYRPIDTLDCYGNCKPCVDGMARTNGD